MNNDEFRARAHELVDWMADYLDQIESRPVKPDIEPGVILSQLPDEAPEVGEPFENIFADFEKIILPGMTHWQHPSFFAYFPANSSPPSILGEMLMSTMGAQCMSWQTSPAATELEERVMGWLGQMIGLPADFSGVIQDTASTATLCSLLSARERISRYGINEKGFADATRYAIYCSDETHSSIEKAVRIAGFGSRNLRKLPVDENFALIPDTLKATLQQDLKDGVAPVCVVATLGTTSSTATDPLATIGPICRQFGVWLHVDAAFAGTALLLPEMRWMSKGIEFADSFVFNPHKWMFTNFDCSAHFVRDTAALMRTFEILPEYLKTAKVGDQVKNYRDWGLQLGRRFRALKLWFVIRTYGVEGLRSMIRHHLTLAKAFEAEVGKDDDFEILAPVTLSLVCFRYKPQDVVDTDELNQLNARLLEELNKTGKLFLTHTVLRGIYTLRMVISQTNVQKEHVDRALEQIRSTARRLR